MKNYLIFFLLFPIYCFSNSNIDLKIIVKDSLTGLPIRNTSILADKVISQFSDFNGYSYFRLPRGEVILHFFHVSYSPKEITVVLNTDTLIEMYLTKLEFLLPEAHIIGKKPFQITNGKIEVSGNLIRKSPSILAIADPLRYIQSLSGVTFISDAFSGIHIRGGGFDQTWIRIDGAPVYNSTHLFGFSSILNSAATQSLTLYKSNLPSDFGTSGSSLIDVTLQTGSLQTTKAEMEIGILNAGFSISAPILKDKIGFISHFRTGYPFFIGSKLTDRLDGISLYYYDWYNKIQIKLKKDKLLSLSIINNADKYSGISVNFFNNMESFIGNSQKWNSFSSVLNYSGLRKQNGTFQINAGLSSYSSRDYNQIANYLLTNPFYESFSKTSNIRSFYSNGTWSGRIKNLFKTEFGFNVELKENKPILFRAFNLADPLQNYNSLSQNILNTSLFYFIEKELNTNTMFKVGNRFNSLVFEPFSYKSKLILNEPRAYIQYITKNNYKLHLSYERNSQVQHIISPNLINLVTDFWLLANTKFTPQISNQFSAGISLNWGKSNFNTELYYKKISNVPDFKENVSILNNQDFFDLILQVKSRNFGLEIDHTYNGNKLTFRNSLTLSKSERFHLEINDGKWYNSSYDIPIKFNSNINFKLTKKWEFTANFIAQSGRPYTHYYYPYLRSDINAYRFPIYHRADVSFFYHKPLKPNHKTTHSWNLSIFNVYNRLNPTIGNVQNGNFIGTSFFPIIPSLNYILKFK